MALSVVVDQSDKDDFEFAEVDEKTSERVGQVSSKQSLSGATGIESVDPDKWPELGDLALLTVSRPESLESALVVAFCVHKS